MLGDAEQVKILWSELSKCSPLWCSNGTRQKGPLEHQGKLGGRLWGLKIPVRDKCKIKKKKKENKQRGKSRTTELCLKKIKVDVRDGFILNEIQ